MRQSIAFNARQFRGGLGEDGAGEQGVGGTGLLIVDAVTGAGVELADDGVGEGGLGVEVEHVRGEGGDGEGSGAGGKMAGGAGGVIAAAGEADGEKEGQYGGRKVGVETHPVGSLSHRGWWGGEAGALAGAEMVMV